MRNLAAGRLVFLRFIGNDHGPAFAHAGKGMLIVNDGLVVGEHKAIIQKLLDIENGPADRRLRSFFSPEFL